MLNLFPVFKEVYNTGTEPVLLNLYLLPVK